MATIGDSITGNENVKAPSPAELTIRSNSREVSLETHEAKVEAFLRRMLPVVSDNATNPLQALVPLGVRCAAVEAESRSLRSGHSRFHDSHAAVRNSATRSEG